MEVFVKEIRLPVISKLPMLLKFDGRQVGYSAILQYGNFSIPQSWYAGAFLVNISCYSKRSGLLVLQNRKTDESNSYCKIKHKGSVISGNGAIVSMNHFDLLEQGKAAETNLFKWLPIIQHKMTH